MSKWSKNLLARVIIAVVFGPAIIYALYNGGLTLLLFEILVVFGLLAEFGTLPSIRFNFIQEAFLIAFGLLTPILLWLEIPIRNETGILLFSAVWFLLELTRKDLDSSLERASLGVFAFVLFSWVPTLAYDLNRLGPLFAVLPIALVWTSDTIAYFAGKIFKGPKMTPVLSPHKTWAGFIGEIVGAASVGIVFKLIWPKVFSWDILIFAIPAGLLAVLGDLFESKVKREMKLKDTSPAIPGHGGVWDRFDSWLFVQLWAWFFYMVM